MKKGPYPLEAVTELPASLPFGPEFLGLLRPAVIGGVAVHVALPNFTFDGNSFSTTLHPRAQAEWVGYYEKDPEGDSRWPFGSVSAWNPAKAGGGIEQFWVSRLLILSKERVTLSEARKLLHAIDGWVQLLETWIEVFARVDLHWRGVDVEHQYGASSYVWLYRGKRAKGKTVTSHKSPVITVTSHNSLAINPLQWRKLLAKASSGEQPPEVHVFLRDARRASSGKRYRRSVLDAATAAEVALTKLRDDALAQAEPGLAEYARRQAQQIMRLVEFLGSVEQQLPDRIQQEIAVPRNRAIHEGERLDRDTAIAALKKAEEVVDLAYPWKRLL
jgi:hypothetical protein